MFKTAQFTNTKLYKLERLFTYTYRQFTSFTSIHLRCFLGIFFRSRLIHSENDLNRYPNEKFLPKLTSTTLPFMTP